MVSRSRIRFVACGIAMCAGIVLASAAAYAQLPTLLPGPVGGCTDSKYTPEAFIAFIFNIVKYLWGITGSIALAMLVFGGFTLLLAGGDPQRVKGGVTTIRNAIVGILLVLGSWLIINTVVGVLTTGNLPTATAVIFGKEWSADVNPCY